MAQQERDSKETIMSVTDHIFVPGQPGKSILVAGPSGSGKSTLLRRALKAFGSGVVLMAPGADEASSYDPLEAKAWIDWQPDGGLTIPDGPYLMAPFDDDEYYPSLPKDERGKADALAKALRFLRAVKSLLVADIQAGVDIRYKVLGIDTFSGLGILAHNAMLSEMGITEVPKARGDGGATFYTGYAGKLHEIARAMRAIRGLGVHLIATSHVQAREIDQAKRETYRAAPDGSSEQIMPLFIGSFREQLPAIFDLVLYSGIDSKAGHYVLWKPDMRRTSKSRLGKMAEGGMMPNDWPKIWQAINEASHPGE